MNTKKLFMLLAAVLLSSASAMAQSGNNEPLKGDVNGDGVVNVADIAAVIAIIKNNAAPQSTYYWYVGHVTNEQFENNNQLTSVVNGQNPTTNTTGPATLTMPTTTGDVLVYIYPTIWGTPNIVDSIGYGTGDDAIENIGLTPPTGYRVQFWDGDSAVRGKTLNITWVK